ncbi:MAG: DoxX family protein [Flavobacteriaceae bacterium]
MKIMLAHPAELLLLLFLIITFLQSGLDKLFDWSGNLSWLKEHFSRSPFKNVVPVLLGTLVIVETIAAILCIIGLVQMFENGSTTLAFYGAILCCIALLMLLFGQRMAKDYEGAKTIAIYFIPAVFLVFLLQ